MVRRTGNTGATLLLSLALCLASAVWCDAADEFTNVAVPGGTTALARALGLDAVPDRARFTAELIRVLHEAPSGRNRIADARLRILSDHFAFVTAFRSALARATAGGDGVSLALASAKDGRRRLSGLLDLLGLQLRDGGSALVVERRSEPGLPVSQALASWGLRQSQILADLNAGRMLTIDLPDETVPLPLSLGTWSRAVFDTPLTTATAFAAVLGNRQAALLCYGLASSDEETRAFFDNHPDLLRRLARDSAAPFSAFGNAVHIRGNTVVPAGGPHAVALWEGALGVRTTDPERFVDALFAQPDGRIAHIFDVIDQLDPAHREFALGTWIDDERRRGLRFAALLASTEGYLPWNVRELPFGRPPVEAGLVLSRLAVRPDGRPAAPMQTGLWQSALDSVDIPMDSAAFVLPDADPIDAAWVMDHLLGPGPATAEQRLAQLAFGQRVFPQMGTDDIAGLLIPIRAVARFPLLMLTLERIGVRSPDVYAAAARHAVRLNGLDPAHAALALELFQGTLAALDRMVRVGSLSAANAEHIVTGLAALPLSTRGYDGGFGAWLQSALASALGEGGDRDDRLVGLVAGTPQADRAPIVEWEGQTYRFDEAVAERRRISDVWSRLGGKTFGAALGLAALSSELRDPALDLADFVRAREQVDTVERSLAAGDPPTAVALIRRAQQQLAGIRNGKDARRAERAADPLSEAGDALLGNALAALAYAAALEGPMARWLSGRESREHDFGLGADKRDGRATLPWQAARVQIAPGVPWHLRGSLLGLETELASALFRGSLAQAVSGAQWDAQEFLRQGIAVTIARLNPADLEDGTSDQLAAAIVRGRDRVRALGTGTDADRLTGDIGMDGWRRAAVRWALRHDTARASTYFSLAELLAIGDPQGDVPVGAWGAAVGAESGCICLAWPPRGRSWRIVSGRPQRMLLSSEVVDPTLHVLLTLRELRLPARLARDVLGLALPDYIGTALPLHADDWWSLQSAGQRISRSQIEDYVAALATRGPLIPVEPR